MIIENLKVPGVYYSYSLNEDFLNSFKNSIKRGYDWEVVNGELLTDPKDKTALIKWSGDGKIGIKLMSSAYSCKGNTYPIIFKNINLHRSKPIIYPNPFTNQLSIDLINSTNVNIAIYDLQGQIIFDQKYQSKRIDLNLDFLSKGTFILKVNENNFLIQKNAY